MADHHGRAERAIAQAEDLIEGQPAVGGRLAEPDPEPFDRVRRERIRPDRLARLGPADPDLDGTAGRRPEVAIERDDAVDFRTRQVQDIGDERRPRQDLSDLRVVLRDAPDGVARADKAGIVTLVNPACTAIPLITVASIPI